MIKLEINSPMRTFDLTDDVSLLWALRDVVQNDQRRRRNGIAGLRAAFVDAIYAATGRRLHALPATPDLPKSAALTATIPKFHDGNNETIGDRAIMSSSLNDNLPEVLKTLRTRPLFVMRLDVRKLQIVGATPGAYRRVGVVPGGAFEGERLSGEVLDGGNDWQAVRSDGATTLNARLVLKTKDEALISMSYRGIRYGPPDIVAKIEKGDVVDPTSYYFRINPLFETANANYDWLNRVVAVGIGHRRADGPIYSIFEVL